MRVWTRDQSQRAEKLGSKQRTAGELSHKQRSLPGLPRKNKDGQGHVYAVINGAVRGNNLGANWNDYDTQQTYKVK